MKKNLILFLVLAFNYFSNAQSIKVAILDFENTSGIAKYDGLGKAMSSMLITDIEVNVSPKRLQLVERSQIQKILKEQNFQASSAVDKSSSVKAGKLLGVKYLLVGDIYILNDVLVINARLTDTETGDIKFSKKQEGKLVGWLNLKTNIAKDLASAISMPFTEPTIADKEVNVATLTTFGNAIAAKDEGKLEKAEELINTVNEFSPDFKYLDDLKSQLDELKKQVEKNTADIKNLNLDFNESIEDPYGLASTKLNEGNNLVAKKYFQMALSRIKSNDECRNNKLVFNYYLIARCNLNLNKFDEAITYLDSALLIYPEFLRGNFLKMDILLMQKNTAEADKLSEKTISFWKNSVEYIDCYEQLSDFSFNSRAKIVAAISQVYSDHKVEYNGLNLEYLTMRNRLSKMHPDFDTVLLANSAWIKDYFSLVNSVAWNKIKLKQYKEAQQMLLEHIIRLATIDYTNRNTKEDKYCLPERKGSHFNSGFPNDLMGYLLGNIAITYIGLDQPEKAKIIYSALKYPDLRVCGYKLKLSVYDEQAAEDINFCELFEQDIDVLGLKNINILDFKNYILKDDFIVLDSFGGRKLTLKKYIEGDPYYLKSYESKAPLIWMTENLSVKKFRNGDEVMEAKNEYEWIRAYANKQPAWCYYNFDPANGIKYGALYNIYSVIDSRCLAPKGYHIPSYDEWELYLQSIGPVKMTGLKLRSASGWKEAGEKSGNGTNESNFNGLPGGKVSFNTNRLTKNFDVEAGGGGICSLANRCYCCKDKIENNNLFGQYETPFSFCHGGIFDGIGECGYWWSLSNDKDKNNFLIRVLCSSDDRILATNESLTEFNTFRGYSVRCLKD